MPSWHVAILELASVPGTLMLDVLDLCAAVLHRGSTYDCGRYITLVRHLIGWVRCNDGDKPLRLSATPEALRTRSRYVIYETSSMRAFFLPMLRSPSDHLYLERPSSRLGWSLLMWLLIGAMERLPSTPSQLVSVAH